MPGCGTRLPPSEGPLIPSPIRSSLATLQAHGVPCLLMGGQACVLYGGAEFSRDLDLIVAARPDALDQLQHALAALRAESIALPPFQLAALERGTVETPSLDLIETVASGLGMTPAERSARPVLSRGQDPPMPPAAPPKNSAPVPSSRSPNPARPPSWSRSTVPGPE